MTSKSRAAVIIRVSTDEQSKEDQMPYMLKLAEQYNAEIVKVYAANESAWRGKFQSAVHEALKDAAKRKFDLLFIYDYRRLTRKGALAMFRLMGRLQDYGVDIISYQNQWINTCGSFKYALLAIFADIAQEESDAKSYNIKKGLERVKGTVTLGRPKGIKDDKPRRRRWKKAPSDDW